MRVLVWICLLLFSCGLTAAEDDPAPDPAPDPAEVVKTAEDGTVLERYRVDGQGRRHGNYARFHENGKPAVKVHYVEGKRDGREQTWGPSGRLRTVHTYRRGVLHGAHKTFDKQGRLREQQVFRAGVLHGAYKSYHPNRRLHVVAGYRSGSLHGKYHAREPDGSTRLRTNYVAGTLHGTYEVFDGKLRVTEQRWERGRPLLVDGSVPFTRTQDALRTTLARILNGDGALAVDPLAADRELALRQLRAYRYLVGVPYDDVVLDTTCSARAQAGAEICRAIGRITHEPTNPGWAAARYALAAEGALGSNLHEGQAGACTSVRGYMDDSDRSNIAQVGHRCWCMNPAMLKTGFGFDGGFTAMWATDDARAKVPDYEYVALPPPGYVPGPWLGPRWAWSVSLNAKHFDAPAPSKVKPVIEPLGADFLPTGDPLRLDHTSVNPKSTGIPYVIVFRAAELPVAAGRRYGVRIEGLTHKGQPKALRYFVEFFDVPYVRPRIPGKPARR